MCGTDLLPRDGEAGGGAALRRRFGGGPGRPIKQAAFIYIKLNRDGNRVYLVATYCCKSIRPFTRVMQLLPSVKK